MLTGIIKLQSMRNEITLHVIFEAQLYIQRTVAMQSSWTNVELWFGWSDVLASNILWCSSCVFHTSNVLAAWVEHEVVLAGTKNFLSW